MKITKTTKGENDYEITGLTQGKLLAIRNALELSSNNVTLGIVGRDVLAQFNKYLLTHLN